MFADVWNFVQNYTRIVQLKWMQLANEISKDINKNISGHNVIHNNSLKYQRSKASTTKLFQNYFSSNHEQHEQRYYLISQKNQLPVV